MIENCSDDLLSREQDLGLKDARNRCVDDLIRIYIIDARVDELLELLSCEERVSLRQQATSNDVILLRAKVVSIFLGLQETTRKEEEEGLT